MFDHNVIEFKVKVTVVCVVCVYKLNKIQPEG